jgi:hypothetical protein
MKQKHIVFNLRRVEDKFIVTGDIDELPRVRSLCQKIMQAAKHSHRTRFIVDASAARVVPGGVTTWIETVCENLSNVSLHYLDSQLSEILQFDRRYQDANATYDPTDLTAGTPSPPVRRSSRPPNELRRVAYG